LVTELYIPKHGRASVFFRSYHITVPKEDVEIISDEFQKAGLEYVKRESSVQE
jgi:hypothetical protein